MKKFKYYSRFKIYYLALFILTGLLAYNFYSMSEENNNYVVKRYEGRVPTTLEYSTNYYLILFYGTTAVPISCLYIFVRSRIIAKGIKVSSHGILVQKTIHSKKLVTIKYRDINNINITEDKVTIGHNYEEIILFSDCFDSLYEYNNFTSILDTNYKEIEKTV